MEENTRGDEMGEIRYEAESENGKRELERTKLPSQRRMREVAYLLIIPNDKLIRLKHLLAVLLPRNLEHCDAVDDWHFDGGGKVSPLDKL
jgi:hypothetical protein